MRNSCYSCRIALLVSWLPHDQLALLHAPGSSYTHKNKWPIAKLPHLGSPQQITWAIGQKSQIIWFVKFLNNHKPIFAFVAMAWKSIPTVCSQMCSRKGRAGENLAARPSFAATRRSLLLLRAEILIREENYGARSEGFDLDNFQRELELFCMESHAGQPCADLIKWVTIVW